MGMGGHKMESGDIQIATGYLLNIHICWTFHAKKWDFKVKSETITLIKVQHQDMTDIHGSNI